MNRRTACVWVMASVAAAACGVFAEDGAAGAKPTPRDKARIGGPCEYVSYPGTATITRIEITDQSRQQALSIGGAGYPGCEVWFSFKTDAKVSPDWARKVAEREQLFRLANSWYPGEKYIDKYGIKVGNTYRCALKVISRGTCTPAMFKFPDARDDDYFESQKEE